MLNMSKEEIEAKVKELGPWFHNIELPYGIQTHPEQAHNPRQMWNWLLKLYPVDNLSGKHVLDIGCNAGWFIKRFEEAGADVIAFDNNKEDVRRAQFIIDLFELKAKVTEEDIEQYRHYLLNDLVFFAGVLYHVENPLRALKSVFDAVKPEGHVIIETACSTMSGSVVEYRNYEGAYLNRWLPSREAIRNMIAETGGEIIMELKWQTCTIPSHGDRVLILAKKAG